MRRFRSAREFESYRVRLRTLARRRGADWAIARPPIPDRRLASATDVAPEEITPCDPTLSDCGAGSSLEEISVTASRAAPTSITNNQEAGVDEGDIVKQYGRFLIVLHDGRLFSIDTGTGSGSMAFVDRINVYPAKERGTWYDELLITDDRLVVTGYDYELNATEIALLRIDEAGVFSYEAAYYITSNDYYSSDNYASRLVDGNLVLYTPLYLTDIEPDAPVTFPKVRRWTPTEGYSEWQDLFAATDIYLPIQRTLSPTVHTISICPIRDKTFRCRSTGVVGPAEREFYVSPEYAYVWVSNSQYEVWEWADHECGSEDFKREFTALPAALYRIPLAGGEAHAVLTAGTPKDQFSLDAREREFLALVRWMPGDCWSDSERLPLHLARIPTERFSARPEELTRERYQSLPTPRGDDIENRYTEGYLVYGGSQGRWGSYYGDADYQATELVTVPLDDSRPYSVLALEHSAERVEVFGNNVIVDGYRGAAGLSVSSIDLRGKPVVSDVAHLDGVLESEGRSHAFNAMVDENGGGMFGLPTVFRQQSWRDYWELSSNVHFFDVDPSLGIHPAGYLAPDPRSVDPDYQCEVSCVDWYGNARPIFMDGRMFALTGTELIEGAYVGGKMVELQRVNISGPPLHRR